MVDFGIFETCHTKYSFDVSIARIWGERHIAILQATPFTCGAALKQLGLVSLARAAAGSYARRMPHFYMV